MSVFHARFVPLLLCFALGIAGPGGATRAEQTLIKPSPLYGDFERILERRIIRVLVVNNPMMFFIDKGSQRGVTHDAFENFEKFVNEKYALESPRLNVVFIPLPRDRLITGLLEGLGDIAAANLTITGEREALVEFSQPLLANVREVLVTGPGVPDIKQLDDLSGRSVYVRKSSSYHTSLTRLNQGFEARGLAPVEIIAVNENLEDHDLLEMVNAGLVAMTIVDEHKADFWKGIFDQIVVRNEIHVREGAQIAWALRKDNPKLMAEINEFVALNKKGTLIGNILFKRYLEDNKWVRNATSKQEREKFDAMVSLFKKYGSQYQFDYLMLGALGYVESRLDQNMRSPAGAVGVMQILPSTANDESVGIADIHELESNIHAGTKYLRYLKDQFFDDPEISELDQILLSLAAYNAGPGKVTKLREEAAEIGLDPNKWFDNVELISAQRIGRETTHYVKNIMKYYVAYKLSLEKEKLRQQALEKIGSG